VSGGVEVEAMVPVLVMVLVAMVLRYFLDVVRTAGAGATRHIATWTPQSAKKNEARALRR